MPDRRGYPYLSCLEIAGYSAETLSVEARRDLAACLYARGTISLGQATELADMPMREFILFLNSLGIPVINYPSDELRHDEESIEWQLRKR